MNLALDASYSLGGEPSGVGVYSRELLQGLASAHGEQRFQWLYRPHWFRQAMRQAIPRNVGRGVLWDGFGRRAGIFHGLNQRLPKKRYPQQVATFHDLFVLTGDYSTPEFRRRFAQQAREAAAQADVIVAVSHFTAGQVHALLNVEKNRIRVIHHGVVERPMTKRPREKLVLSVGAIQTRKNTARLIEAFRSLPPGWRLILAGSSGYGSETVFEAARKEPMVEITGYQTEAQLADLYSRASIFAFPSLDEGFGMPVLEAMAAGVPVITSNRSAMPEIAGDAAIQVNPENVDEIAAALNQLARDPSNWPTKGRARATEFTWSRAVQQTWNVYGEFTSRPQPRS